MTQEEKQLLLKDLCARLLYGVKCSCIHEPFAILSRIDVEDQTVYYRSCDEWESIEYCKPYLRPMSSMTEDEKEEYDRIIKRANKRILNSEFSGEEKRYTFWDIEEANFLNAHHFDYRGLIPMGLALEAPEGMYKTE